MSFEKKTIDSVNLELQKLNHPSTTINTNGLDVNSKRTSVSEINLCNKEAPLNIQILVQMMMWCLDGKFKCLNLPDMLNILENAKVDKDLLANELFNVLHPSDLEEIVKLLLDKSAKNAIEAKDMNVFMRSNTLVTMIFKRQCKGVIYGDDFVNSIPDDIKRFKEEYERKQSKIHAKNQHLFEVSLIHKRYEIYLRNFLKTIQGRFQDIPQFIKRNCFLIYEALHNNKLGENIILNKIGGGYLFLRFINPSMDNYILSESFKDSHIPKKTNRFSISFKSKPVIEDPLINWCRDAIKIGVMFPMQKMANALGNKGFSDNNNEEESSEKKNPEVRSAESTWKKTGVEIANEHRDLVAQCTKHILSQKYEALEKRKEPYESKCYDFKVVGYAKSIMKKCLDPSTARETNGVAKLQKSESETGAKSPKELNSVLATSLSNLFTNGTNSEPLDYSQFDLIDLNDDHQVSVIKTT